MNFMELIIEFWLLDFQMKFTQLAGSTPAMLEGYDPVKDLIAFEHQTACVQCYLYYIDVDEYNEGYWSAFQQIVNEFHPTINFYLASSEFVSNQMGIDGDIPDLWILSMEKSNARRDF